jgi:hypothetical protein
MPRDEEKSNKPRQMVHKAQAESINWIYKFQQVHQGLADTDRAKAQAGLHNAVLLYWRQIDRFSDRGQIEHEWYEEPEYNARKGRTETVRVEKPWRLDPQDAIRVHEQLDKCAHQLGFDAVPKSETPTYGWIERGDEIADETEGQA